MSEPLSDPDQPVILTVEGMTCGSCARTVEQALRSVPGVRNAQVDLTTSRAVVSGLAEPARLLEAVQAAGYPARTLENVSDHPIPARWRGGCC